MRHRGFHVIHVTLAIRGSCCPAGDASGAGVGGEARTQQMPCASGVRSGGAAQVGEDGEDAAV